MQVDWMTVIIAGVAAILGAGGITPLMIKIMEYRTNNTNNAQIYNTNYTANLIKAFEERIKKLELSEETCLKDKEALALELTALKASNVLVQTIISELLRTRKGDELKVILENHRKEE